MGKEWGEGKLEKCSGKVPGRPEREKGQKAEDPFQEEKRGGEENAPMEEDEKKEKSEELLFPKAVHN